MEEPTDQFAEALALAQEIAKDCARAFRVDKKFFVYNYNEEMRKFLVGW